MPRFARVVVTGEPYHITHRGNHRAAVFFEPEDREVYLAMLAAACIPQNRLSTFSTEDQFNFPVPNFPDFPRLFFCRGSNSRPNYNLHTEITCDVHRATTIKNSKEVNP
ncbi:MAG: hypothetical protein ACR2IE_00780 [Candidatus Sumerlaeaceae bacterium]